MPTDIDPNPGSTKRQQFIQRALEALRQSLEPEAANTLLLSAVPHWLEEGLLNQLSASREGWPETAESLLELQLAHQDEQGRLHYTDEVRTLLRSEQKKDAPQKYLAANRVAHDYFLDQASRASVTERPRLEREALYHRLIYDEPGGLRLLNEKLQEALYYHQVGLAEQLVLQASELRTELGPPGGQWLRYFTACLELAELRQDWGETLFQQVAGETSDPILGALTDWRLGQLLVARHHWSQAIRLYKHSLERLDAATEPQYRARVLLSLGQAYQDLAENSGSHAVETFEQPGRLRRFVVFCQHLPFLCIEWAVRHISFLPNIYFGTDYQDWIIDRLLYVAEGWMVKAERLFARTENPVELTEARLALAGIEHEVGHWSRARHRYARLEHEPVIANSQYRLARVRLGQGRASLLEGKLAQAVAGLTEAAGTFRTFEDPASLGTTSFLLGQAYTKLGKLDKAIEAFLESAQACEVVGDRLMLTRALWNMEALAPASTLSAELRSRMENLLERIPSRHTLSRFPVRILRLYRNLALLAALPLAYAMAYGVITISLFLLSSLEALFYASSSIPGHSILFFLSLLVKWILPVVLPFWIYRGIYGLLGFIAVYFLGNRLVLIEREQPVHLAIDPQGITSYSSQVDPAAQQAQETAGVLVAEKDQKLEWSDITALTTIDYQIISRPINLISRMFVQSRSTKLVVEGSTMGYPFLKRDIQTLLSRHGRQPEIHSKPFIFLEWRSTLIACSLVLAFVSYLYRIDQIAILGLIDFDAVAPGNGLVVIQPDQIPEGMDLGLLPVSTILEYTVRILLLVLPAVILWRVWIQHNYLVRTIGRDAVILPPGIFLAIALLLSAASLGWIFYLAFTA